jgi:hypothetical protein
LNTSGIVVVLTLESTKFDDHDEDSGATAAHPLKRKAGDPDEEGPQRKITRVQVNDAMLTGSDPVELNEETLQGSIWRATVRPPCATSFQLP